MGAGQRADRLPEHPRTGGGRRAVRLACLLDGGAPLPAGVLALLEPRGPLRRHRRADRAHAPRLRRAPDAPALQPPGADGRVGGRTRPDLRRPGRFRHRALGHPGRARGIRDRPRPDPGRCGRRPSSTWSGAGPTRSTSSPVSYWQMPRRRVQPKPLQKPHPPIWGATTSEDGHRQVGELGLGLCSFAVGHLPRGGQAEGRRLPPGGGRLHRADRGLRAQRDRHLHHGAVRRQPGAGARPGPGVLRVVPEGRGPADRLGLRMDGRAQRGARVLLLRRRHEGSTTTTGPSTCSASST